MEKRQAAKKAVKKAAKKTTKKKVAKKITKKRTAKKVDEGKTVNLQGTAKMKVNVTQYGKKLDNLNKLRAEHPEIKIIINTMDNNQVMEFVNSEEGEAVIREGVSAAIIRNARRMQPLPENFVPYCQSGPAYTQPINTPKPEYRTRTARAIAAIRHTANNVRERVVDFLFPPWNV